MSQGNKKKIKVRKWNYFLIFFGYVYLLGNCTIPPRATTASMVVAVVLRTSISSFIFPQKYRQPLFLMASLRMMVCDFFAEILRIFSIWIRGFFPFSRIRVHQTCGNIVKIIKFIIDNYKGSKTHSMKRIGIHFLLFY